MSPLLFVSGVSDQAKMVCYVSPFYLTGLILPVSEVMSDVTPGPCLI